MKPQWVPEKNNSAEDSDYYSSKLVHQKKRKMTEGKG